MKKAITALVSALCIFAAAIGALFVWGHQSKLALESQVEDFLDACDTDAISIDVHGRPYILHSMGGFTDFNTRQLHMWISAGLGITMALCLVIIVMVLLLTPAEVVLRPVFAPLGRMALSNYIGATLLILAAKAVVPDLTGFDDQGGYLAGVLICVGIMVFQIAISALWLRFVGQGPLEKLWRLVTWGRR